MNINELLKSGANVQLVVGSMELKEFARDIIREFLAEHNS